MLDVTSSDERPVLAVTGLAREARIAAGPGVITVCSGGDPKRLRTLLEAVDGRALRAVISFGLAGGLDPALRPGDLVVATEVAATGRRWKSTPGLVESLAASLEKYPDAPTLGRLAGVEAVVLDAVTKAFPQAGFEKIGQSHVGASIGSEIKWNAVLAGGVSMLVILIYIAFRFEFGFGIGAMVATLHDLLMTIGVFVLSGRHFDAPMVAAILCIAGYSINETVVVFDRIREELKLAPAAPLREVVNNAVRKVFARTIMTASTTTLAALALFVFGGGVLRDISFTFLVGIGTSTFSAIFVAAQVFYAWHKGDRRGLEVDEAEKSSRRPWERAR